MRQSIATCIATIITPVLVLLLQGCNGSDNASSPSTPSAAIDVQARAKRLAAGIRDVAGTADVVGIVKVGEVRVSRTEYDYIFQLRVAARSYGLPSASITLKRVGAGSRIIDGAAMAYGLQIDVPVLSADTVTIRHDRMRPFDEKALAWDVRGPAGLLALPVVNKPALETDFVARPGGISVVANQLIVTTRPDTTDDQFAELLIALNMRVVGRVPMARIWQVETLGAVPVDNLAGLLARITQDPTVQNASFNVRQKTEAMTIAPDDPTYSRQQWAFDAINVKAAWKYLNDNAQAAQSPTILYEVKVGVIDSGFDRNHADLAFERLIGPDGSTAPGAADPSAIPAADTATQEAYFPRWSSLHHGMNVAGIIAATHHNKDGATGVLGNAPRKVYGARVDGDLMSTISNVARLVVNGVRVVNISMGFAWPALSGEPNSIDMTKYEPLVARQVAGTFGDLIQSLAASNDFLIVTAAGNEKSDAIFGAYLGPLFATDNQEFASRYAVARSRSLIVGATRNKDANDNVDWYAPFEFIGQGFASSYSNFGIAVEIMAPGGGGGCQKNDKSPFDPPVLYPGDEGANWQKCLLVEATAGVASIGFEQAKTVMTGTSQATPFVSGAAALILSMRPDLAAQDVKLILTSSKTLIADTDGNDIPLLDLYDAVKRARTEKKGSVQQMSGGLAVVTEVVCRLPNGLEGRERGVPVSIRFTSVPETVFRGSPDPTTNDRGFNFIEVAPQYAGLVTTGSYSLSIGPGVYSPEIHRTGTVPSIKGGVLTFKVAFEAKSESECGSVDQAAVVVTSNFATVDSTGPARVLFLDRFDSPTLDASKWRADPANASTTIVGAYEIRDGALRVDVPGGTNGYFGKNSGNAFVAKAGSIVGDFEVTATLTEILRASAQRDNSGVRLLFGRTGIGLRGNYSGYWWDGAYGSYHRHRLEASSSTRLCLLKDDLDLSARYSAQVRIRRSLGVGFVAYRVSATSGWIEAPCELDSSGEVWLQFETGDGGYTTSTGRFVGTADNVVIRVP